jgi:LPLT family lysophospholipid transporter-like MFS transporter
MANMSNRADDGGPVVHRSSMNLPLLSVGMGAVLMAQFLSALSDNAILIAAIAIAKKDGTPELIPWLQGAFLVPFILLAPFSGPLADSFPKGRVMLVANLLKLAGASAMALGVNSVLAYGLVGIGATMYSPAKYGILSQMFRSELLVRANGMLEGSTIAAILLGVLVGGWLADVSLAWAFGGVIAGYALATVSNLLIPRLPAESVSASFTPALLVPRFWGALRLLFADRDARFSLLGTSVFWGSGTTLRLVLFAWVPVALLLNDNQTPANLMGVLSVGIVAGAAAAGIWISLATVNRALLGGLLLGPAVLAMTAVANMSTAVLVMALIGFCGGLFVVPLNALLQKRGHESVGAGSALAVQNFFENITMLFFVGVYSLVRGAGVGANPTVGGFGIVLLLVLGAIALMRLRGAAAPGMPARGGAQKGSEQP